MKVSDFINIVVEQERATGTAVFEAIQDLFFGNRPKSVDADSYLTSLFRSCFGVSAEFDKYSIGACIILTNPDVMTEEQKKMSPRQFVENCWLQFDIAIQIL